MTPRAMRSWPGTEDEDDEGDRMSNAESGRLGGGAHPTGGTCPVCDEGFDGHLPGHLQDDCEGAK